jgi:hypothetical protein
MCASWKRTFFKIKRTPLANCHSTGSKDLRYLSFVLNKDILILTKAYEKIVLLNAPLHVLWYKQSYHLYVIKNDDFCMQAALLLLLWY